MRHYLTSIVAIDRRGAIGCKNRLPWSIKSDLAFFRKTTIGNNVIMGRKTFESIGGCLKGRTNFVLSHNVVLFDSTDTCKLVTSVGEALAMASPRDELETFVIGGAATYSEFAPFIDRYLVTIVDHVAEDADSFLDDNIRTEINSWNSAELGTFPAEPGRDDFGFRIVEYLAPDAQGRQERRKALASQLRAKALNQKPSRSDRRANSTPKSQAAFSF